MDPTRASMTALGTAVMRAIHTRRDPAPLITDPWGERLVNESERTLLRDAAMRGLPPAQRGQLEALDPDEAMAVLVRAHPSYAMVILRTRYAEDALEAAVARGVRQYVIIGAGMDSFALRRPPLADLGVEGLNAELARSPFDPTAKTFQPFAGGLVGRRTKRTMARWPSRSQRIA